MILNTEKDPSDLQTKPHYHIFCCFCWTAPLSHISLSNILFHEEQLQSRDNFLLFKPHIVARFFLFYYLICQLRDVQGLFLKLKEDEWQGTPRVAHCENHRWNPVFIKLSGKIIKVTVGKNTNDMVSTEWPQATILGTLCEKNHKKMTPFRGRKWLSGHFRKSGENGRKNYLELKD